MRSPRNGCLTRDQCNQCAIEHLLTIISGTSSREPHSAPSPPHPPPLSAPPLHPPHSPSASRPPSSLLSVVTTPPSPSRRRSSPSLRTSRRRPSLSLLRLRRPSRRRFPHGTMLQQQERTLSLPHQDTRPSHPAPSTSETSSSRPPQSS